MRSVLALVLAFSTLPTAAQGVAPALSTGCFFVEESGRQETSDLRDRVYRRNTGNVSLDQAVNTILLRAARAFSFERSHYPAFRFLPPGASGGDGFAKEPMVFEPGTQGLVALSLTLLEGSQPEETRLLGFEVIAGHEFAHIFKVRKNYIEPLQVAGNGGGKYVELHADFMSGWFVSQRGQISTAALQHVVDALFSRGDNKIGSPGHHGTKEERFAAVLQGYLRGGSSDQAEGAAENGIIYLQELMK
jgi:hypothetical protein